MSHTYSTRGRDLSGGNLFSSLQSRVTAVPQAFPSLPGGIPITPVGVPSGLGTQGAAPAQAAPEQYFHFAMTSQGTPGAQRIATGAAGTATLGGRPGSPWQVSSTITGVNPVADPAIVPALWLIHDLAVPPELAPADQAMLPRGSAGAGNLPGTVFTLDGNPATYGPSSNTLSVAVTPGGYRGAGNGTWHLAGTVDANTNYAFHPLVMLGPAALFNIDHPLPSGTVARILTDVFMRPASVHPELSPGAQFPQRLMAVTRDVLAAAAAPEFIDGGQFTRAAVTMEGLVRGTPRLMPTRDACFLMALQRMAV